MYFRESNISNNFACSYFIDNEEREKGEEFIGEKKMMKGKRDNGTV